MRAKLRVECGEYIVYSLTETDNYYIMVLLPFLCLVWTSGRHNEAHRDIRY